MEKNPKIIFLRKKCRVVGGEKKEFPHPWAADLSLFGPMGIILSSTGFDVKGFMDKAIDHVAGNYNIHPDLEFDLKGVMDVLSKNDQFCRLMRQHIKPHLLRLFRAWPEGKVGCVQVSDEEMSFVAHSLKNTIDGEFTKKPSETDQFCVTLRYTTSEEPIFFLGPFLENTGE